MWCLSLLLCFCLVQFSIGASGIGEFFGFVFRYPKPCFCRCGIAQQPQNLRTARLSGGHKATPHQFPWLAAINVGNKTFGGSLISDRHILTAASPLYGIPSSQVSVTLGAHDRCSIGGSSLSSSVDALILRAGYSPRNGYNDIALLRLTHEVPFSQYISPVCLPLNGISEYHQVAWTVSWSEEGYYCFPQVASLPILPAHTCYFGTNAVSVTADKGCLGPLGAKSIVCENDVGAPVMARWNEGMPFRLIGVLASSSCDQPTTPLYTRVIDHAAWIHDHIRDDCQCL